MKQDMMSTISQALVLLAAIFCLISRCSCRHEDDRRCQRFGGGSCCRLLTPLDYDLEEVVASQPTYVLFLPRSEESVTIDNMCFTYFPVPGDSTTYILYESRVYIDGFNDITTYLLSDPGTGARKVGRGLCQYVETVFAEVECDRNVYLKHRCHLYGDCPTEDVFESPSNVYGFSEVRLPIPLSCLNNAKAAIRNNGLAEDEFYILPMRLPSRCVLNQACDITSALQRFCQTVGVDMPTDNTCADLRQ